MSFPLAVPEDLLGSTDRNYVWCVFVTAWGGCLGNSGSWRRTRIEQVEAEA